MKKAKNIFTTMLSIIFIYSVSYADAVLPGGPSHGKDGGLQFEPIKPSYLFMLQRLLSFSLLLFAICYCVYVIIDRIIKSKKNNDKK